MDYRVGFDSTSGVRYRHPRQKAGYPADWPVTGQCSAILAFQGVELQPVVTAGKRRTSMKTAFVYTDAYMDYDYGPTHPLKVVRLKLTYELIKAYGLLSLPSVQFIQTRKANEEDVAIFHRRDYLAALRQASEGLSQSGLMSYGLGPGDNPIFKGVYDWSLWVTGATLQAGECVANGERQTAFNIAGGLHHAQPSRASGFCYMNDVVVGISKLIEQGKRVVYIDIDAHHGDGVQEAFYKTDRVLTISLHQSGYTLFPGTGQEDEVGEGEGAGYSVNVPFPPMTDDKNYLWAFEEIVPPLVKGFSPDVVVTQLGVDTFYDDPLANLHLSMYGFEKVVQRIKDLAPRWIALGGGGYEISNVARAWTLVWAVMNEVDLPESVPESYQEMAGRLGIREKNLRGDPPPPSHGIEGSFRKEIERIVEYHHKNIFPKIIH